MTSADRPSVADLDQSLVSASWESAFELPDGAVWTYRAGPDHCDVSHWLGLGDDDHQCPTCGVEFGAPALPNELWATSRIWLYELPDQLAGSSIRRVVKPPGVLLVEAANRTWIGHGIPRTHFEHADRWHLCLAFVQLGFVPPASACVLLDPSTAWDRESVVERTAQLFDAGFSDDFAFVTKAALKSVRTASKSGQRIPYLEDEVDVDDQCNALYALYRAWQRRRDEFLTLARGRHGSVAPLTELGVLFGHLGDMREAHEERERDERNDDLSDSS